MRHRQNSEVVYVERGGDSSVKWLFCGVLLGAGLVALIRKAGLDPWTGERAGG